MSGDLIYGKLHSQVHDHYESQKQQTARNYHFHLLLLSPDGLGLFPKAISCTCPVRKMNRISCSGGGGINRAPMSQSGSDKKLRIISNYILLRVDPLNRSRLVMFINLKGYTQEYGQPQIPAILHSGRKCITVTSRLGVKASILKCEHLVSTQASHYKNLVMLRIWCQNLLLFLFPPHSFFPVFLKGKSLMTGTAILKI